MRWLPFGAKKDTAVEIHNKALEYEKSILLAESLDKAASAGGVERSVAGRPPLSYPLMTTGSGSKIPMLPYPRSYAYNLAVTVDSLRVPIDVLNREVLRNGFEILPYFRYECKNCGKEYHNKPLDPKFMEEAGAGAKPDKPAQPAKESEKAEGETGDKTIDDIKNVLDGKSKPDEEGEERIACDECGSTAFTEPKSTSRKKLKPYMKGEWNKNGQKIDDIVSEIERDLDIFDDFYVVCRLGYTFDSEKRIKKTRVKEVLVVWPPAVQLFADKFGRFGRNDGGQYLYLCIVHRDKLVAVDKGNKGNFKFFDKNIPACPECGRECIPARMEISPTFDQYAPDVGAMYFGDREVIHSTGKFMRGKIYGYSPIFTIWSKVVSMHSMDEYVRTYFDKQRPPKGLLILGTRNHESLKKAFDDIKQSARTDPHGFHPLIVDMERAGRNMAQFINLTGSLEDLQFTQVRDEYRRSIGAVYGVLPFFCYVGEDHEVLGKDGWVSMRDVTVHDEIATHDPENNTMKYSRPSAVEQFRYHGKMYEIESEDVSLKVTKNHKVYARRASGKKFILEAIDRIKSLRYFAMFTKAARMEKPHYFGISRTGKGDGVYATRRPGNAYFNLDVYAWLGVVGQYLIHGSESSDGVLVAPDNAQEFKDNLKKLDCAYTMSMGGNNVFSLNGPVAEYLARKFRNGAIDSRLLCLPIDYLSTLLRSMCDRSDIPWKVKCYSEHISDMVQELSVKTGMISRVEKLNSEYLIRISTPETNGSLIAPDMIRETETDGAVAYAITVPTGILVVRRNRKVCLSGNSGDLPTGWNQEGTEVMVQNRTVAWCQGFIVDKFLKPFCEKLGVRDWYLSLKLGEEMDEMRKEQIQTQKINNAQMMGQMGYKHYQDGDGNFVFSQRPVAQQAETELGSNAQRSEQGTRYQGEPKTQRPSDPGGIAQGHPASGPNTSQSKR